MEHGDGGGSSTMQRRCERLRRTIAGHRRRTEQERAAFEQFRREIASIADQLSHGSAGERMIQDAGTNTAVSGWTQPVVSPTVAAQELVREAFTTTVMELPFYDEEYGESLQDAIVGEFGPTIATGLTNPDCFGPHLFGGLLQGVEQAQRAREVLLETCDREQHAIGALSAKLPSFSRELAQVDELQIGMSDFGALEAYWHRLETIADQCGTLAMRRQRVINRQRAQYQLAAENIDIYEYLYRGYPVSYPMLAMITSTIAAVEHHQHTIMRAMGGWDGG